VAAATGLHDTVTRALPDAAQTLAMFASVSQPSSGFAQLNQPLEQVGEQSYAPDPVEMHVFVPCEFVHVLPQPLQFWLVPRVVSHPLPVCMSQFAKPVSHVPIVQVPVVHDSAAFVKEQGLPHVPQSVSVEVGVSQPSFTLPLQSRKRPAHVGEHT
jgi:hypothetical protein